VLCNRQFGFLQTVLAVEPNRKSITTRARITRPPRRHNLACDLPRRNLRHGPPSRCEVQALTGGVSELRPQSGDNRSGAVDNYHIISIELNGSRSCFVVIA